METIQKKLLELDDIILDSNFNHFLYITKLIHVIMDVDFKTDLFQNKLLKLDFYTLYIFKLVEIREKDKEAIESSEEEKIKKYEKTFREIMRTISKAIVEVDKTFKGLEANYRLPFNKYIKEFKDFIYVFFDKNLFRSDKFKEQIYISNQEEDKQYKKKEDLKIKLLNGEITPATLIEDLNFNNDVVKSMIESTRTSIEQKSEDYQFFKSGIIPLICNTINYIMRKYPKDKGAVIACDEMFRIASLIQDHLASNKKKLY